MYDFTDLSRLGKISVLFSCFAMLIFSIPLASGVFLFLDNGTYEYSIFLALSCLLYKVELPYAIMAHVLALLCVPLTFLAMIKIASPKAELFGSARMAKQSEIRKAKLYKVEKDSIIVGKHKGKLMAFNGDFHVFLSALTGAAKTVSFVIPNLLNWGGSVVSLDIKRECYDQTSEYRRKKLGNSVYIFNPLDSKTDCFNPFDFIPEGEEAIAHIQSMADTLIIVDDEYWDTKARQLFLGLALLLQEQGEFVGLQKNIGQLFSMLGCKGGLKELIQEYDKACVAAARPLSQECLVLLNGFCNEEDKPRGSIISSLSKHLELWIDPRICRATAKSSFDLETFRTKKQSLYLVSAPKDLKRLNTVFRLLLETFVAVNTKVGEEYKKNKKFNVPVLMMLDEFIQLGRMEALVMSLSYIRGWGIKMATVIQSTNQLKALYGADLANFFEENHRCSILFRPNRMSNERVKEMAEALGKVTARSNSETKPAFGFTGNRTVSNSQAEGFLVTPDQIRDMADYREFVLIDGLRPIFASKSYYYKERKFVKRVAFGASQLPDNIKAPMPVLPEPVESSLMKKIKAIFIPKKEILSDIEIDKVADQFCLVVSKL